MKRSLRAFLLVLTLIGAAVTLLAPAAVEASVIIDTGYVVDALKGDEALYVLEGSMTLEYDDKPAVTVKAGESAYNAPKLVHNAKNASTTTPVKIVTFMVSEKGHPLAIPAP